MKPRPVKFKDMVVYLLHYNHSVEPTHYVGITTPGRLDARMREHQAGRGSKMTAAACKLGLSWSLAAVFPTHDRADEKKIAAHRSLRSLCPLCNGGPAIASFRPTKMAATGEVAAIYEGFNLNVQFRQTPPKGAMKKEPRRRPRPFLPTLRQT